MRPRHAIVLLAPVLAVCGCAASVSAPPAAPEKPPITVAIIGFGGTSGMASAADDGCVLAVLEAGFRAVERRLIVAALPNENDVDYTALGKALACDLIIDGGVARGTPEAPVRLEPRLISTHSAGVLGDAKSRGRVRLQRDVGQRLCAELLTQLP